MYEINVVTSTGSGTSAILAPVEQGDILLSILDGSNKQWINNVNPTITGNGVINARPNYSLPSSTVSIVLVRSTAP